MTTASNPLADPSRLRLVRFAVAGLPILGLIAWWMTVGGPLSIGLLAFSPTIGAAGLMLLGPLDRSRKATPIAGMPADGEPAPCADCGYLIQPPASRTCPECGGSETGMPSTTVWRWLGRTGEFVLFVLTILTAAMGVIVWATSFASSNTDIRQLLLLFGCYLPAFLGPPMLGIPAIILQLGTRGRVGRWWIPLTLTLVALSVPLTDWPAAAVWRLHHADAEALHARVIAGETIDLPVRLAEREIRRIDRAPDGTVGYLVSNSSTYFYRTAAPTRSSPGEHRWWTVRLHRLWWFHMED